jgi:uncharacterized membrane protein
MRASNLWRANSALLLIYVAAAVIGWLTLPDRIPVHFGLGGAADAWTRTSAVSWFGLCAITIAISWLLYLVSTRGPLELWNIPEKERFLRLTAQQREPVLELLRSFMAGAAICCTVCLFALHTGLYLVARGDVARLPWYTLLVMYSAIALLLISTAPSSRAVRRAVLRAADAP